MNTPIIKSIPLNATPSAEHLISLFLKGRKKTTCESYHNDLMALTKFLKLSSLSEAINFFLSQGQGHANMIALSWQSHLKDTKKSSGTINRHLATLRSIVKLAKLIGFINWDLTISNLKNETYRDTFGPGQEAFSKMLALTQDDSSAGNARNNLLLHFLFDLALRASEIINLDYEDIDFVQGTILILGKGREQKEKLTLPQATQKSLQHWIKFRGEMPGPLFLNFDHKNINDTPKRLTRFGLYQIVKKLGEKVGIKTRPHGIRHLAITQAIKAASKNGLSLDQILDFSRHKDVSTLMFYNDRIENKQKEISDIISSEMVELGLHS